MNAGRDGSKIPAWGVEGQRRVLFVTPHKPWPASYGAAIRALAQLRALEAVAQVDLVVLGSLGDLRNEPFYRQRTVTELPWSTGVHLPILRTLATRLPDGGYWWATYVPGYPGLMRAPAEVRAAFQKIVGKGYDVLYLVRPETYWYLGPRDTRVVVDIDDVQSQNAQRAFECAQGMIRRLAARLRLANVRHAENELLDHCAVALVCSDDDARELPHRSVVVLPNPIPEHGQTHAPVVAGRSERLVFVGALKYRPNVEAVRFFVGEVLPLIRARVPAAHLDVIGAYRPADVTALRPEPGVELLGFIESLQESMESAAVVVAPLREGMGTRIKILEALSFGKPVVATSIGAQGIPLGPDDGLFRADEPRRLADACVDLMCDPNARLLIGRRAKDAVYRAFGEAAFGARMNDILERAGDGRGLR